MDDGKRKRLESAGFKVGTVEEFLSLSPAESAVVEARLALSKALKRRRQAQGISQAGLARKMRSSQSRVAKIEAGDSSVSLDLMARAFFETGASLQELADALAAGSDPQSKSQDGLHQ
jgi:Predicted transcriptional regulator with C-terminal CBS domains